MKWWRHWCGMTFQGNWRGWHEVTCATQQFVSYLLSMNLWASPFFALLGQCTVFGYELWPLQQPQFEQTTGKESSAARNLLCLLTLWLSKSVLCCTAGAPVQVLCFELWPLQQPQFEQTTCKESSAARNSLRFLILLVLGWPDCCVATSNGLVTPAIVMFPVKATHWLLSLCHPGVLPCHHHCCLQHRRHKLARYHWLRSPHCPYCQWGCRCCFPRRQQWAEGICSWKVNKCAHKHDVVFVGQECCRQLCPFFCECWLTVSAHLLINYFLFKKM